MLALTVESAKNLGLVITIGLVASAVIALWTITALGRKLVTAALIGVLALGVWTQRQNLRDCGDNLRVRVENGGGSGSCRFFGTDVRL